LKVSANIKTGMQRFEIFGGSNDPNALLVATLHWKDSHAWGFIWTCAKASGKCIYLLPPRWYRSVP